MASYRITDRDLYRYSLIYSLPDFVKNAAIAQLIGPEEQDATLFADPATRIYATHTKAATWVSTAYFLEHAEELPQGARLLIARRLTDVAAQQGISDSVRQLHEKYAEAQQPALVDLPDQLYGWLVKDAANKVVERRLRLLNPCEIKVAAEWLLEHRDRFRFLDRQKIARRIIKRAVAEQVSLDEFGDGLDKLAGFGDSPTVLVVQSILQRSVLLRPKQADVADSLQKLAAAIEENPLALRPREQREKLASLLDRIDRENDLQLAYKTAGLLRPEESLFGLTAKMATNYLAAQVSLVTGSSFQKADLEQLSISELREKLGVELADAISSDSLTVDSEKAAASLPNLSAAQATMFEKAASSLGLKPQK